MLKELLKPEIEELVETKDWIALRDVLEEWSAPEIADLLYDTKKQFRVLIFRAMQRDLSTDVFSYLEQEQKEELLRELTDIESKALLEDMATDDRTALLEELPANVTLHLLNLLSPEELTLARQLLGYPEDSVGRHMTPDFVRLRAEWMVSEAIDHIRKFGKDSETLYRIYVTNNKGELQGDVMLRGLILAEPNEIIANLMDENVVSLSAFDHQEKAVRVMEKYDVSALPVLDSQGILVGIVTFDDIFDIYEEEATEDFQKIGAINPVDKSYLSADIFMLYRKRIPWLIGLLLASFFTAGIIDHYQPVTLAFVALASFIPMLIGTAGNTGTQSATLIVRALSTGDIDFSDWLKVFGKEMAVGLLLGGTMSAIAFLRGVIEPESDYKIAVIISVSMITMVTWANIIGSFLPIIISKFKLDPAVISGPLIATLLDATGVVIYYNVAIWYLEISL